MESKFIQYKGKEIHLLDFSELKLGRDDDEALKLMEKTGNEIRSKPEKSVLSVLYAINAEFNHTLVQSMKTLVKLNNPYVKKCGVVGIKGMLKIIFNAVIKFTGREAKLFDTKEQALDWLIQ